MSQKVWSAVVLSLVLALATLTAAPLAAQEPESPRPITQNQLFEILDANQTPAPEELAPEEQAMASFYVCSYTCDPCWLNTECAYYSMGERCVRACN